MTVSGVSGGCSSRIAQPYIEHNIASGPQSSAIRIREWLATDHGLSKREVAVAELVAAGRCNKMIGGDLSIAVTTVKTHLVHIFDKVGVDSRAALIAKINAFSS
ncbi:response regulator transcription factor [Burkholderia cenocepacia]|uniref:response regulator transcription factor n=1 Tax=Burkholderia cenocepacia TaxID=95486 RepID=UPI0018DEC819|nr:LuxR C-terminal-related transcriptional regulator [Burkholderia cenocepacia]